MRRLALAVFVLAALGRDAEAAEPSRDRTWGAVSTVGLVGASVSQLVMPRIFRAEAGGEQTIGTKARWHLSVLAPVMTLSMIALGSELALKPVIRDERPGCDATNHGAGACTTFGMPSTHALGAVSAFGHGAAVFAVDTFKYGKGEILAGPLIGDVVVPLLFAATSAIGRGAGDFASGSQVLVGSGVGLVLGAVSGLTYAMLQRPDCGYTGNLVCW